MPIIANHIELEFLILGQTGGFFVESGAFDGEYGSNTLFMERHLQWKGILVEPDRKSFDKLLAKRRRSWALPVCLATEPYPTKVQAPAKQKINTNKSKENIRISAGFV